MNEDFRLDLKIATKEAIEEWANEDTTKHTGWGLIKEMIIPVITMVVIGGTLIWGLNYYNNLSKQYIVDNFDNNKEIFCYNHIIQKSNGWRLSNNNNFFVNDTLLASQYIEGCEIK